MTHGYLAYSFDLLNVGDLDVIAQARRHCDHLVVGVYSDEFARQMSGRSPVVPLMERMELLRYVRGVDEVVVHDSAESYGFDPDRRVFMIAGNESVDSSQVITLAPTRTTRSPELLAALAADLESGAA
jgi:cytidyltransferase-like protein